MGDQNGRGDVVSESGMGECVSKRESEGREERGKERKMGGRVGEEMKYGEMVTHSSGGKALIYSLCLFWVIYCGRMRVSISTWPLVEEA